MRFKYPGFDVALVTALWIAMVPAGIWISFSLGHIPWYVALATLTGLTAVGVWFQIRSAGYVFSTINLLLSVVGVIALILNGYSMRLLLRVAFTIYTAYVSLMWTRGKLEP